MSPFPSPGRPTRWIGLAAAALLVAGLAVGLQQTRRPEAPADAGAAGRAPAEPPPAAALIDPPDSVVEQALGQIPVPVDSAALKSRWMDRVPGVDLASLTREQHDIFLRFANAERCTCGCGYTLAACRAYDPECPVSLPWLRALLDSVRTGRVRSAAGLRERPRG